MQLRALPLLWRDAATVQVGTDPRWAVALGDLSPGAAGALASLPPGASDRALRAALAAAHVPAPEADAVLRQLAAARLLIAPSLPSPAHARADGRAWSVVVPDGDGSGMVEARARARVRVVGLDRVGALIAHGLAIAGVGTITVEDPAPVGPEHLGVAGLGEVDLGSTRARALAAALHDARPGVRTLDDADAPDLVVLVRAAVADPVQHTPLTDTGTAHLSVVVREASVLVGPLVEPTRSACLTCVDLHRADADPSWPALAAQLLAAPPSPTESTLASSAAALACAQALAHLDRRPHAVHDAALEITLPGLVPYTQHWPPHPSCGCGGQLSATRRR